MTGQPTDPPPRHKALSRAYEPLVPLVRLAIKNYGFLKGERGCGGIGSPAMSNLPDEFRDV